MYQERHFKNVLKAVIGGEGELGLMVFEGLGHAEQRLGVRALDVRLYIARRRAAEDGIDPCNPGLNALLGDRAVSPRLIVEGQRGVFVPRAELPQLNALHIRAVSAQLSEVLGVRLEGYYPSVAAARVF